MGFWALRAQAGRQGWQAVRDSAAGRKSGLSPLADFGGHKLEERPLDSPWSRDSWEMVEGLILDKVCHSPAS